MGKDLKDMTDIELDEEVITREKMLRISGQLYKNLEWMYGACSFNWKLFTSMCLELTTPQELTLDISQRDPLLVKKIKEMLKELPQSLDKSWGKVNWILHLCGWF